MESMIVWSRSPGDSLKLETKFLEDNAAIFEVSLGRNDFLYCVDFVKMVQTNVSAGGHRERRLCRGDPPKPPLDLERYIAWDSLQDAHPIALVRHCKCSTPHPIPNTSSQS